MRPWVWFCFRINFGVNSIDHIIGFSNQAIE